MNKMNNIYIYFLFLFIPQFSFAQKHTISGYVKNKVTKEPIEYANVSIKNTAKGDITDKEGKFVIKNIKSDTFKLVVSYIGYDTQEKNINYNNKNNTINIWLEKKDISLEDIIVRADRLVNRTSVSDASFKIEEMNSSVMMQDDPLRSLALLPGVTKGDNSLFSSTQLYVRGGAPRENLFYYDNCKVYWPWYFGGMRSIFNPEIIDKVELLTGGFPAKYGNALSSVLRVTTKDGNFKELGGNFSLSFANMQAKLEGPIIKDSLSFIISSRKTYLDFFMDKNSAFPVPNLFDISYKGTYKINSKHKLTFSGLSGREKVNYVATDSETEINELMNTTGYTNTQSLQWRSMWSDKIYSNLSIVHSQHNDDVLIDERSLNIKSHYISLRYDVNQYINDSHKLNYGFIGSYTKLNKEGVNPIDIKNTNITDTTLQNWELSTKLIFPSSSAYLSYTGDILNNLSISPGIRVGHYHYSENKTVTNLSPRFALKYNLTPKTYLRGAYGIYRQSPKHDYIQNTDPILLDKCQHYILGLNYKIQPFIKAWIEGYYKKYSNLTLLDHKGNYINNGEGSSKGLEFLLMKLRGNFLGWISYALSFSKRQGFMQKKEYYTEYDRRHIVNISLSYKIDKYNKFIPYEISTTFRFETGNPYTPVMSAQKINGNWFPIAGEINSKRNPNYHNLNLKIKWYIIENKKLKLESFIKIWNMYSHKNLLKRIYSYGEGEKYGATHVKEELYYSLPFLPTGGLYIKF